MENLLNAQEAANKLGIKMSTFKRLVRQGRIPIVELGEKLRRFNEDDLEAVVNNNRKRYK